MLKGKFNTVMHGNTYCSRSHITRTLFQINSHMVEAVGSGLFSEDFSFLIRYGKKFSTIDGIPKSYQDGSGSNSMAI